MIPYSIINVEFITPIEDLFPGWAIWECEAVLEDGSRIAGCIQGDGVNSFDAESFEEDEGDI